MTAAQAPVQLGQLQQQYQAAKAALDQILQEEKAGIRSPDFLARKEAAEVGVREALQRMYDAHATAFTKTANAADAKNKKQVLHSAKVDNPDGTTSLVSSIMVNGETYYETFTPPRFNDIQAATKFATDQVNKETPSAWNPLAGKPPYQGTAQEEIARRVKVLMEPRLVTMDRRGQQVSPELLGGPGGPTAPAAPTPGTPTPQATPSGAAAAAPGTPDELATAEAVGGLTPEGKIRKGNLTDRQQLLILQDQLRTLKPEDHAAASIHDEIAKVKKRMGVTGATTPGATSPVPAPATPAAPLAPTPSGPIGFTRDAAGNIVPVGAPKAGATPTATTPAPVAATPGEQAGQLYEQARAALLKARNTLMSYGIRQQRADPVGYRNALTEVARLQTAAGAAQEEYSKFVAPGAATMPLRPQ